MLTFVALLGNDMQTTLFLSSCPLALLVPVPVSYVTFKLTSFHLFMADAIFIYAFSGVGFRTGQYFANVYRSSHQLTKHKNSCGQPNIYLEPIRCQVTGVTSTTPLATPKPAVWCEDDKSKCVEGAKQVIIWNQKERNNIVVEGNDLSGHPKSPAYNEKLGFRPGIHSYTRFLLVGLLSNICMSV
jgi:hypothetical protein